MADYAHVEDGRHAAKVERGLSFGPSVGARPSRFVVQRIGDPEVMWGVKYADGWTIFGKGVGLVASGLSENGVRKFLAERGVSTEGCNIVVKTTGGVAAAMQPYTGIPAD